MIGSGESYLITRFTKWKTEWEGPQCSRFETQYNTDHQRILLKDGKNAQHEEAVRVKL